MDSDGGFHMEEKDDKVSLVYHHPKYNPIPQTQCPISSGEAAGHDHHLQPMFLCPTVRWRNHSLRDGSKASYTTYMLNTPPEYVLSTTSTHQNKPSLALKFVDHPLLPFLVNKNSDFNDGCRICYGSSFGTEYYLCETHQNTYHKECVESPLKIKHPYHPEHSLQLYCYFRRRPTINNCLCCGRLANELVYYCNICHVFMHPVCAMKPIPFVIDQPKRHDHPLTFFPRQTSLVCNVCGLLRKTDPTYVCLRCNFVAHRDCMYFPRIIKISRHHHRISYVSSLRVGEGSCRVCRQRIDGDYGAYTCDMCIEYDVHSRCALRKDVWDGEELEGKLEEDVITQDTRPFHMVSEGVILHFLHGHHLRQEACTLYDENKLCRVCVLPIFEGKFYSCMESDFILHERCANAHRVIQHDLHPHPLTLTVVGEFVFGCNACGRICGGVVYKCLSRKCFFQLDVRCAAIFEPFNYQSHEHPLFLSNVPGKKPICAICKSKPMKQLNCIKCDFDICFKCATLPYTAKYKHDKHFITLLYGKEVCEKDWCEVCERNLQSTSTKIFYWCKECCTIVHIECLFGEDPYLMPGQIFYMYGKEVQILRKNNLSRPYCDSCKNPCQSKILKIDGYIECSVECIYNMPF